MPCVGVALAGLSPASIGDEPFLSLSSSRRISTLTGFWSPVGCNKNIACLKIATCYILCYFWHLPFGPEGPAAGAKRPHVAEGREGERSETVIPEATD